MDITINVDEEATGATEEGPTLFRTTPDSKF